MRFLETIFSSQLEMLREKINPLGQLCNTFPLLLRNMLSLVCSVSLDSVWHHWLGVFKGALLLLLTGFDYINTSRLWKLCLNPYVFEGDTPVQNFFFCLLSWYYWQYNYLRFFSNIPPISYNFSLKRHSCSSKKYPLTEKLNILKYILNSFIAFLTFCHAFA